MVAWSTRDGCHWGHARVARALAQRAWRGLRRGLMATLLAPLALTSCGPGATTLSQGAGLPTLRPLDWGYGYFDTPTWSPDGRWIAALAGDDYEGSHLEVVSPDGRTRHDLSVWGCGHAGFFAFAWLPDGRLNCFTGPGLGPRPVRRLCVGAPPFARCRAAPLAPGFDVGGAGATWAPDGAYALLAASSDSPERFSDYEDLQVVAPDGRLLQTLPFSERGGISYPAFVPHAARLSYVLGGGYATGPWTLEVSPVSWDSRDGLRLGPPRAVVGDPGGVDPDTPYAWAPSGHWVAVRDGDLPDKIYLVNPDDPAQTVDIAVADRLRQQMASPIWSPDGRTLIVFSVGYNVSEPYAIDIASYLQSKGLEP